MAACRGMEHSFDLSFKEAIRVWKKAWQWFHASKKENLRMISISYIIENFKDGLKK